MGKTKKLEPKYKIVFVTSWYWEGAYVLKTLLDNNLGYEIDLVIQKPWWGKANLFGYSINYWKKYLLDNIFSVYGRRYFNLQFLSNKYRLSSFYIDNINESLSLIFSLQPDYVVVVGSRIIKKNIIDMFPNKIINFHTGILPYFRGPYSEFWALYKNKTDKVGTTIHLIDYGIDTGDIISQRYISVDIGDTPETLHIKNVKSGALLLSSVLARLKGKEIKASRQLNYKAHYYSHPTEVQVHQLQNKLNRKFNINFIE